MSTPPIETSTAKFTNRLRYLRLYRQMHRIPEMFAGHSLEPHGERIGQLLRETGSATALDFGCGKGWQYSKNRVHELHRWGLMPSLYDPGVKELARLPEGPFDAVLCTDVLEHVPELLLKDTLHNIFSRSLRLVYLAIAIRPAIKNLPNGENAHCTVHPPEWWMEKLQKHSSGQRLEVSFQSYGGLPPVVYKSGYPWSSTQEVTYGDAPWDPLPPGSGPACS